MIAYDVGTRISFDGYNDQNTTNPTGWMRAIVETCTITWARSHGMGHRMPGSASILLRVPGWTNSEWQVRVGASVTITVDRNGWSETIFRGTIRLYTRKWDRRGHWLYQIEADDNIATAAATPVVQALPWPEEPVSARIARLNTSRTIATSFGTARVAPRDVDNRKQLEIIELTAGPTDVTCDAADGTITWRPVGGSILTPPAGGNPATFTAFGNAAMTLAAANLELVELIGDRTSAVGTIRWTRPVQTGGVWEETTTTSGNPAIGSSQLSLVTDQPDANPTATINDIIGVAYTSMGEQIAPCRLVNMTDEQLRRVIGAWRDLLMINVSDLPDTPLTKVETLHRVIGSTLTIRRGRLTVTVTLQPAVVSGTRIRPFNDRALAGVRFDQMGTITFAQIGTPTRIV